MTMSAPRCSCDGSLFPSMGRPCLVHGSKWNRDEMESLRARVATMDADAADYAAMAEAELSRFRAENERLRVSRVEYDAALKRVREHRCYGGPCPHSRCVCAAYTLAALGLDEPPTEKKPFDVRDHPMAFPSHHDKRWVPSDDSPVPSDRSSTGRKNEPPTDPARTCDGCAAQRGEDAADAEDECERLRADVKALREGVSRIANTPTCPDGVVRFAIALLTEHADCGGSGIDGGTTGGADV